MRLKISSMQLLLAVSVSGVIANLIIVSFIFSLDRSHEKSFSLSTGQTPQKMIVGEPVEHVDSTASPKQASPGIPIHLNIPKIGVDAEIDSVGVTADGAVGAPKGPTNVTWFNLGPRPGDNGSAVITGHYGQWKNGDGSVFDDLSELNPGDKIYIEDEKGATLPFVVRELHKYDRDEYVSEAFSSDDGKAHLNLITCEGIWIKTQRTYSGRLIVFADKEMDL
jgi:LPXTG-site transpeptidase (sortase) family protein